MERVARKPVHLSFKQINELVQKFLRDLDCQDIIPVPIENIVTTLGFDVIPIIRLGKKLGVEGFLLSSRKELYIDKDIHDHPSPFRYNSTLAHEMGHFVLHQDHLGAFASENDYETFLTSFDEHWLELLEWQAWDFARLLLIPSRAFPQVYNSIKSNYPDSEFSKLEKEYPEFLAQKFSVELAKHFCVSEYIAKLRIRNYLDHGI
ncbi:ImmA/IrrE family metallo-endopeptidase [Candidatus Saganbacteria bacterium]|uniref:ImmA/IrrE family metallo-endopeptidase n=1 Tax=Candidatus Saganbacteria bacterium TaxID=2575572 RepID=A0A9D6ULG9_UNCSA|nr:ImmA/IrrE family metallo-endopeptidase [Candidatus Saganbacteria bacterium]